MNTYTKQDTGYTVEELIDWQQVWKLGVGVQYDINI